MPYSNVKQRVNSCLGITGNAVLPGKAGQIYVQILLVYPFNPLALRARKAIVVSAFVNYFPYRVYANDY
jgi:hypothetical protein